MNWSGNKRRLSYESCADDGVDFPTFMLRVSTYTYDAHVLRHNFETASIRGIVQGPKSQGSVARGLVTKRG